MLPGMAGLQLQGILLSCNLLEISFLSREELLLELVAGLASGLHHLHQAGIYHGAVCARNVFMVGETGNTVFFTRGNIKLIFPGAKLGGFGMSNWSRPGEQPDCTRWMVRPVKSHLFLILL